MAKHYIYQALKFAQLEYLYRYTELLPVSIELVQHFFEIMRWMMTRDQPPQLVPARILQIGHTNCKLFRSPLQRFLL